MKAFQAYFFFQLFALSFPSFGALGMAQLPNASDQEEDVIDQSLSDVADSLFEVALNSYVNEPEPSKKTLQEALDIFIKIKDKEGIARCQGLLGNIALNQGDYLLATQNFTNSLRTWEELGSKSHIAKMNNNVGLTYDYQGKTDMALQHYLISVNISKEIGLWDVQAAATNNIAIIYHEKEALDTARNYYLESLEINQRIEHENGIATNLHNLGKIHATQGDYDKGLELLMRSLAIDKKLNNQEGMAFDFQEIGHVYYLKKEHPKALSYFLKSHAISKPSGFKPILLSNYRSLADLHHETGEYEKAFNYLNQYTALKDSVFDEQKAEQINLVQSQFEFDKKEQEIALLTSEKEVQDLKMKRRQSWVYLLGVALVALLIIALVFYSRSRLKLKANRILEEKNHQIEKQNQTLQEYNVRLSESEKRLKELISTKDRFFSIISHDLKSPINSLLGMSTLIYQHFDQLAKEDLLKLSENLQHSSQELRALLDNLLHWARSQMGTMELCFEPVSLKAEVEEVLSLVKWQAQTKSIRFEVDVPADLTLELDRNVISLSLRNLISNAIKFSLKDQVIHILFHEKGTEEATLEVRDQGVGMSSDELTKVSSNEFYSKAGTFNEKGTGLGLILCKEFLQKMGCELSIKSEEGKGSSFFIHFKKVSQREPLENLNE